MNATAAGASEAAPPVTRLVGFARALRVAGVPVGVGQVVTYCAAVGRLGPADLADLYWAGRATLINRAQDLPIYDAVFLGTFGAPPGSPPPPAGPPRTRIVEAASLTGGETDDRGEVTVGAVASPVEVLRHKRFAELSAAERWAVHRLLAQLAVTTPRRVTRRRRAARRGRVPDLRRSLRRALRTDGELLHRSWRRRRVRPRPLVLLLDVSGSMTEYSRALLAFAHAVTRGTGRAEVFCFGTRITRITDALAHRDPDAALAAAAARVVDWDGGTRIGAALSEFLRRWGRAGVARGAVVVVCSDGLERGDPTELAAAMARLHRLAYRVVWVNPLKGDPRYQPLARGMAAALPYVDVFLPGHDLASLEALAGLLSSLSQRARAPAR